MKEGQDQNLKKSTWSIKRNTKLGIKEVHPQWSGEVEVGKLRSEGKAGKKFGAINYLQNFKNEEVSEILDETVLKTGWAVTISGGNQNNQEKLPSLN